MKKTIALLLTLALLVSVCGAALGRAADDAAESPTDDILSYTGGRGYEAFREDAREQSVDISLVARQIEPDMPGYDLILPRVYAYTVEWGMNPGVYHRTADAYAWNCDTQTYERTAEGEWEEVTRAAMRVTVTNRSNVPMNIEPLFVPERGVTARMIMDTDMAGDMDDGDMATMSLRPNGISDKMRSKLRQAGWYIGSAQGRDVDMAVEGEEEPTPWYQLTGMEQRISRMIDFPVTAGFANITDRIGTLTLKFTPKISMNVLQ